MFFSLQLIECFTTESVLYNDELWDLRQDSLLFSKEKNWQIKYFHKISLLSSFKTDVTPHVKNAGYKKFHFVILQYQHIYNRNIREKIFQFIVVIRRENVEKW